MKNPATPSTVRFLNRRSVIRHLLHEPALSRAELAKAVGLSPVTAGKIVDDLIQQRVLEAVKSPSQTSRVGRPGNLVRLDRSEPRFLAVQLGVTHTRFSAVPLGVSGNDTWQIEVPTANGQALWAASFAKAIADMDIRGLWGIVIGVPGILDHAANRSVFSPNLHWIEGCDFSALLRPLSEAPVLLVQEVQALAMGQFTARPDVRDFLLVNFSNGVGGAAVIGGDLYKTALPLNSELGHSHVLGNRRRCGCGAIGCVETLVSRNGLFQSVRKGREDYSWEKVLRHVEKKGLEPWLKEALDAAAAAIGSALNVLGLRHLILTGSINELPPAIGKYLSDEIQQTTLWARFGSVAIDFAPRHRVQGLIKAGLEAIVLEGRVAG